MSDPAAGVIAETARLCLREKRIGDAVAEYAWRKDPEVARYDATPPLVLSYSEFVQQFERDLRFSNPARHAYAIETVEGAHIGALMYYNADHVSGAAEYGIFIGPAEHRGAGLGAEATIAFLRFAWRSLPLRRIYLHTLEWNERARRSFERAGFRPTRTVLRHNERFLQMEARREWWLLWDSEGRFAEYAGGAPRVREAPASEG